MADGGCRTFHLPSRALPLWMAGLSYMTSARRVVVTGMGVVTPVGNDLATFWQNLSHGVSGIGPSTNFDVSTFDCRIAGEVRGFDPESVYREKRTVRRTDRFVQLAAGAAKEAMADAGFEAGKIADPERFGCIVGSGI